MQTEIEESRKQLAHEYIHVASRIDKIAFDKYGLAKMTPELLADYKAHRVMKNLADAGISSPAFKVSFSMPETTSPCA